ncbi:histidine phosphatase family protein [Mycobacterium lacus]|uniref:Phosphoglycerate mutase n=1 Tax=Mycobacterium lacus TaxID=169765 RepID=A0A1X1YSX5_9MYCO|nr:histidine phosphatase family protein [Mycobacterium lacus]MCV7122636.1 histidine phosphatase family protein [Mycobacterium lacus]ORW14207.1 histidine phosphatase [Mycobacterium lacus]BBX99403.1 phosphoglycerate mutase [Mycobacterium lacus]
MTEVVRLTLVSHGMTDAMAAGRFPVDEPLNDIGRRQVEALDVRGGTRQLAAPELRARQTAQLLGLRAMTEPRLADLDCGRWRGETLEGVAAEELRVWLTDPARAPHGGESIVDLIDRVAGWLASLTGNTVAVTHPAVIRAAIVRALDIPSKSFWRLDIRPLSRSVLHSRGQCWTLRL